ncbi:hypothetical protein [Paenibacillus hunanensis]|uniref:hypothetical protein n=1 Tax=Paenibacillus hunanensis TaxID=539262 RepID=UPI00286CE804|nr:hypothetical protein [Paenibacillus hunanensis]
MNQHIRAKICKMMDIAKRSKWLNNDIATFCPDRVVALKILSGFNSTSTGIGMFVPFYYTLRNLFMQLKQRL